MSGKVVKEGYLIKKAMKSGVNWKKRYIVLSDNGVISYSENKGDPPKKQLQMSAATAIRPLDSGEVGNAAGFSVTSADWSLWLKTKKGERDLAQEWLAKIEKVINGLGGSANRKIDQYGHFMAGEMTKQASGIGLGATRPRGGRLNEPGMPKGWIMKVGNTKGAPDYFVSEKFEYFASAQDCKDGKPPKGKAILSLLV